MEQQLAVTFFLKKVKNVKVLYELGVGYDH